MLPSGSKVHFDFLLNVEFNQSGEFPPEKLHLLFENVSFTIDLDVFEFMEHFVTKKSSSTELVRENNCNMTKYVSLIPKEITVEMKGFAISSMHFAKTAFCTIFLADIELVCAFDFLVEHPNALFHNNSYVICYVSKIYSKMFSDEIADLNGFCFLIELDGKHFDRDTLNILTRYHKDLIFANVMSKITGTIQFAFEIFLRCISNR